MDREKRKRVLSDESSDSDRNELLIIKTKKAKKKSKSESKDHERSRSSKKAEKSKHKKDKKSKSKSKKKHKSRSGSKRKARRSTRSRSKSSDSDSLSTSSDSSSVASVKSTSDYSQTKQKSPSPDLTTRPTHTNLIDTDSEDERPKNGKPKQSNGNGNGNGDGDYAKLSTDEIVAADVEKVVIECADSDAVAKVVSPEVEVEELALTVTAAHADALAHIDSVSQNKLMDEIEQAFLKETEKIANLTDLDLDVELGLQKSPSEACESEEPLPTADGAAPAHTSAFEEGEADGKIDKISIMVQTDYHIDPDEPAITNSAPKLLLDKAIYCNTDPLYSEKDEKVLTMAEIEKLIAVVDDQIADLHAKKKHFLALKQDKLLKKKKIQNAVNNKSSIEFGLFDNCLTLTKKGTLRIEQSPMHKKDNKSNIVAAATAAASTSVAKVERDCKEPFSTEKERSEPDPKKNNHETVIKKRGRKKRIYEKLDSSSSEELDHSKKVASRSEPEEAPQKKRRLLLDKYSKKSTSRKNYKSSAMVMEDSSESDVEKSSDRNEKSAAQLQALRKHRQSHKSHRQTWIHDKKYRAFFEQKCLVRLYSCDLNHMRDDFLKKMKQDKQNKMIDISYESIANEEIVEDVDMDENFDVVMVSDRSSSSENEDNSENNNQNNIDRANKSDEAVDILKLLDKKHEVITEFIT